MITTKVPRRVLLGSWQRADVWRLSAFALALVVLLSLGPALAGAATETPTPNRSSTGARTPIVQKVLPTATPQVPTPPPVATPRVLEPHPLPQPYAAFDWSMPSRFGADANGDRLIDYFTTWNSVNPPGWRVDFNACASTGRIHAFRWSANGQPLGEHPTCDGFWYDFASEGTYQVTLTVVGISGQATATQEVVVQDWLIVGLGDSYASGEGAPDISVEDKVGTQRAQQAAALERARQEVERRISKLIEVRVDLHETEWQAVRAQNALNNWQRVCVAPLVDDNLLSIPDPSLCVPATATLAEELLDLGITTAIEATTEAFNLLSVKIAESVETIRAELGALESEKAYWEGEVQRLTLQFEPDWQDKQCHRSAWSGQAQAALEIERRDPRTSVTFVHVACGGATISEGILGSYEGTDSSAGDLLPPQIFQAKDLIGNREVDAMLVSVGGNDVYFGPMIMACMFQPDCSGTSYGVDIVALGLARATLCPLLGHEAWQCEEFLDRGEVLPARKSAREMFEEGMRLLPDAYIALAGNLQSHLPDLLPDRVYISEYPNPSRDQSNLLCVSRDYPPRDMLPGVTLQEITWVDGTVVPRLNQAVAANQAKHGWKYVGGIADAFRTHGYCASDHWLNRLQESYLLESGPFPDGAVHPNKRGYAEMGRRIAAALEADFYPTESLSAPRKPRQPLKLMPHFQIDGVLPWTAGWR